MWFCYVLENTDTGRSYCGMTCDLSRRLRQHNREIVGGARATARGAGGWRAVVAISGFPTQCEALRAEWSIKHHARRRRCGGRGAAAPISALQAILAQGPAARWTSRSARIGDYPLRVAGDRAITEQLQDTVPIGLLRTMVFEVVDA